jgi:hypothetical protein
MTTEPTLYEMAVAYAKRGLHVFPCRPRDKEPACAHGVKDATIDINIITGWWGGNPDCNIGMACGEKSGVFVVDIDGGEAETALAKLEEIHNTLPPTVESITPRGRHSFYRWPNRVIRNSTSRIGPNIDVRGRGGYVLVPPSIHPSGRPYAWSVDSARVFAVAPDWLLDLIAAKPPPRNTTPPEQWRELAQGVSEGARNCSLTSLAGMLLRRLKCPAMRRVTLSATPLDAAGRSGWTQEELAAKEGQSQFWISKRTLYGRFLSFISTDISLPKNLTERRFRDYWQRTDKAAVTSVGRLFSPLAN